MKLYYGGIMANYQCTAACRHCLQASSPTRTKGYITDETAHNVCAFLREKGCRVMHIGGGEPFIDFTGLLSLVKIAIKNGVYIDYIETNAFWAENANAEFYLKELKKAGVDTFCISVDPFHAEYVSPELPVKLAELCQNEQFRYFLWQERFLPMLLKVISQSSLHNKPLSRKTLEEYISKNYIIDTARRYGISYGGRALNIEAEFKSKKPVNEILNNKPCTNILSGDHFHVDMFGNYIPPGCTGIFLPLSEVANGILYDKYPVLESLVSGGISGLFDFAVRKGFTANPEGYTSSCAFCFHIRKWLSENGDYNELDADYYTESLNKDYL